MAASAAYVELTFRSGATPEPPTQSQGSYSLSLTAIILLCWHTTGKPGVRRTRALSCAMAGGLPGSGIPSTHAMASPSTSRAWSGVIPGIGALLPVDVGKERRPQLACNQLVTRWAPVAIVFEVDGRGSSGPVP